MKVLIQRVTSASVSVEGTTVGRIGNGLLLLVGIAEKDSEDQLKWVVEKCLNLRIFEDDHGKMNRSVIDVRGELLAVSQFTLLADSRKGRRPSYMNAAEPGKGQAYYNKFVELLKTSGLKVENGIFGAMMDIDLVNRGPVTLMIEKDD